LWLTLAPDGQITGLSDFSVHPFAKKYFASPIPQIKLTTIAVSSSHEGRIAIVTDVGMRCGGRGHIMRESESQGGLIARERSQRAR
jgi:hypothetical protein